MPFNDMRPLKSNAEPTDAFFTAVHHRSIKLKKKKPLADPRSCVCALGLVDSDPLCLHGPSVVKVIMTHAVKTQSCVGFWSSEFACYVIERTSNP